MVGVEGKRLKGSQSTRRLKEQRSDSDPDDACGASLTSFQASQAVGNPCLHVLYHQSGPFWGELVSPLNSPISYRRHMYCAVLHCTALYCTVASNRTTSVCHTLYEKCAFRGDHCFISRTIQCPDGYDAVCHSV